jgi:DNA-binding Lrp family transcriptional regulator
MLNEKDIKLLSLLNEDARQSVSELARKLNVSRTAAQARLEKLENNGVITGYNVKLGKEFTEHQVKALVMIKSPPSNRSAIETELRKIITLSTLYSISGAFDLAAVLTAQSVGELDQVIDKIGAIDGVQETMSSIILSTKISR